MPLVVMQWENGCSVSIFLFESSIESRCALQQRKRKLIVNFAVVVVIDAPVLALVAKGKGSALGTFFLLSLPQLLD